MRERIDVVEALRLYHVWQCWREVAIRMVRKNGMCFCWDAVQAAVRRHDRSQFAADPGDEASRSGG